MSSQTDEFGAFRHVAVMQFPRAPVDDFYACLGFDKCTARERPSIEYMRALTNGVITHASIAKVANQYGTVIEIISVETEPVEPIVVWNHIAITVSDCAAKIDELRNFGGVCVGGPTPSPDGPYVVAYVRDASENLVELVQPVNHQ